MGATVIHLDPGLHARAKAHCRANNTSLKSWVSLLLQEALGESDGVGPVTPVQKPKPKSIYTPLDPELWSKPPFWSDRTK